MFQSTFGQLDHVWIKAFVLVAVHLAAPSMRQWLEKRDHIINAFGGGMAISYVFIHLLPEVGEGKVHLGVYTFIITLVGYVLFSFFNQHTRSQNNRPDNQNKVYKIAVLQIWLYSFILIIGLPKDFGQSHAHIMLMTFATMIHVIHSDYEIELDFADKFRLKGRYILATAPIAGLLVRWFLIPESDVLVHAITSILAGVMIYSVARKEIPVANRFTILWFAFGIFSYTGLLLVIESL